MREHLYSAYQQDPVTLPSVAAADKRTTPRFLDGQMTYLFPLNGPAKMIEIIDSGAQGLGLASHIELVPGSKHWLQIIYRGGARRRFMVEILYCRPAGEKYHCGARLVTLDTTDRMHWRSYQGFISTKGVVLR